MAVYHLYFENITKPEQFPTERVCCMAHNRQEFPLRSNERPLPPTTPPVALDGYSPCASANWLCPGRGGLVLVLRISADRVFDAAGGCDQRHVASFAGAVRDCRDCAPAAFNRDSNDRGQRLRILRFEALTPEHLSEHTNQYPHGRLPLIRS